MKNLSKYLLRVKSKNTLSSCELVIRLRWVIIYAALVVEKEIYIYSEIYTFFFSHRDGLIVFAALFPDVQFLLYMIIPVKVKWLALLDGVFFAWAIIQAFLPSYGGNLIYGIYYKANALAAVVSLLNFFIFFMGSRNVRPYTPKQMKRKHDFKKNVRQAERPVNMYAGGARHRCAVCGRTELDDPNLEFRYCSKCNGNYEYCQDHLFTHTHVK